MTSKRSTPSAARKSALAVAFSASSGIPVASATRSIALLREMEEALRETGTEVAAHAADVGSPDGAARLIEVTVAAYRGGRTEVAFSTNQSSLAVSTHGF